MKFFSKKTWILLKKAKLDKVHLLSQNEPEVKTPIEKRRWNQQDVLLPFIKKKFDFGLFKPEIYMHIDDSQFFLFIFENEVVKLQNEVGQLQFFIFRKIQEKLYKSRVLAYFYLKTSQSYLTKCLTSLKSTMMNYCLFLILTLLHMGWS